MAECCGDTPLPIETVSVAARAYGLAAAAAIVNSLGISVRLVAGSYASCELWPRIRLNTKSPYYGLLCAKGKKKIEKFS